MFSARSFARYLSASVAVALATGVRRMLDPILAHQFPFATLFMAVLGASAYGGRGPGLWATGLGALAAIRFMLPPDNGFEVGGTESVFGLGLYAAVSLPIVLLGDALRKARGRAELLAETASRDRDQLRVTLASIGEGVIVTDVEGRVVSMNASGSRLSGWTEAEAAGRPFDEVFKVAERDNRAKTLNLAGLAVGQRESLFVSSALLLAHDGQERWIDATASSIRDDDDRVTGVVLVVREVAERLRAEVARKLLASIVESSQDAIYGKSLDGTITSWNEGAQRLYGYSAEEVIGQPSGILTPAELVAEQSAVLKQHHETEEHFETVRRRKDGTLIHVSTSISPVRNEMGAIVGSSTIARDITRQKRAEEELKKAEDELRQADRRKDEFLAILAHELRNPLAPLRNALGILRKADPGSPAAGDARTLAERQVHHLSGLVDDLLDVSRITHGRIALKKKRIAVADVVAQALETAEPAIRSHGHSLRVQIPEEPIWIEADELRIVQIIANLLNNASQYSTPGGRIEVGAALSGAWVEIRVSDTGIGIAPDVLPRVFEMFTQVSRPEQRAPQSLGIGLNLAKGLVELHGGRIEALSAGVGQGSVFVVRLPVLPKTARKVADTQPTPVAQIRKRRILIVDDNVDAAESLAVLLGLEGHETETATSGLLALEAIRSRVPEVVLLDIGMPGMDGYEVARRIRRDPDLTGLRLVALTGWGQDSDLHRTREAGFDRHLTKPVEPSTLFNAIADAP